MGLVLQLKLPTTGPDGSPPDGVSGFIILWDSPGEAIILIDIEVRSAS